MVLAPTLTKGFKRSQITACPRQEEKMAGEMLTAKIAKLESAILREQRFTVVTKLPRFFRIKKVDRSRYADWMTVLAEMVPDEYKTYEDLIEAIRVC